MTFVIPIGGQMPLLPDAGSADAVVVASLALPSIAVVPSAGSIQRSGSGHMTEGVGQPGRWESPAPPAVGRLTPVFAVAMCTLLPVLQVVALAIGPNSQAALSSAVVTVCYLPLFLRIVVLAMSGRRSREPWWCVGGLGLVLIGGWAVGAPILPVFLVLLFGALLLIRSSWALATVVVLAAVEAPVALAWGAPVSVLLFPTEMLWLYALVALVAAVRRLERARRELAEQVLLTERLRIDDDLRRTVGVALDDLATRGDRLAAASKTDRVATELVDLVAAARRALTDTRRIARGYQRAPLHVELQVAVTLLATAGVPARVVLPDRPPSPAAVEALRRDLHAATASLLHSPPRPVVLRVIEEQDRLRLVVQADDASQPAFPDDAARPQVNR